MFCCVCVWLFGYFGCCFSFCLFLVDSLCVVCIVGDWCVCDDVSIVIIIVLFGWLSFLFWFYFICFTLGYLLFTCLDLLFTWLKDIALVITRVDCWLVIDCVVYCSRFVIWLVWRICGFVIYVLLLYFVIIDGGGC